MNNFVKNVNKYIKYHGIKQSFISLKSNIEKNKLSRLLNGKQDILQEDMKKIALALDKNIIDFLNDDIVVNTVEYEESTSIAFYMGTPTREKENFANLIFDFIEHIDAVLGVKDKLNKNALDISEVLDNGI
ncbi:MAG: helix-turn-helix domain-containing protein [Anaeromicrobium sp.]|uniref:helix-turn-helix domain-containing protein n=1 Tax=Anaeromicrobium sp. TaxID=1929132 RepID=UPI0025E601CC|nr:helix-turn-helix transcriptional regulator [Anaeromicrobium sp.]MCT4595455.1 helix-turn-helix domain-containing protein [Anaeromicrobium sp.]